MALVQPHGKESLLHLQSSCNLVYGPCCLCCETSSPAGGEDEAEPDSAPSITEMMRTVERAAALPQADAACDAAEALLQRIAALGPPNGPPGESYYLCSGPTGLPCSIRAGRTGLTAFLRTGLSDLEYLASEGTHLWRLV